MFLEKQHFNTKLLSLFSDILFFSKMVTMVTTKYHSRIPDVSNYSSIKFYVRIRFASGNILDCYLSNYAFIICDVTQSIKQLKHKKACIVQL